MTKREYLAAEIEAIRVLSRYVEISDPLFQMLASRHLRLRHEMQDEPEPPEGNTPATPAGGTT